MEEVSSGRVHRSGRRGKAHSKHDHKCHKARHKSAESLADRSGSRNYLEPRRDSGSSPLSPFEMNVGLAYRHVKSDNAKLRSDIEKLMEEKEEIISRNSKIRRENEDLKADVSLMKILVYKLNVELEKYQSGGKARGEGEKTLERLPSSYEKDFIQPVLPLLKAYSEALQEKDDMIRDLESDYKKFSGAFNDLLHENEKLYVELEKKFMSSDGSVFNQVKLLKKDLEMAKQENNLLLQQIKLEKEKLAKVQSAFKVKVEEVSKEREDVSSEMEGCRGELYLLRGKYAVLKQEFERLKMDHDTRVPLAVHSASVNECRNLFQDLKNEYENEKQRLTVKITELEGVLAKKRREEEDWAEEKNFLEKTNFNQTFEMETLRRKISELENQLEKSGKALINRRDDHEVVESKKNLREANKRIEELSSKLTATKKQLQKAMIFAEDIVRGQEGLLLQLHAKQKENSLMTTQFGSIKSQLKVVGKGVQEDLISIEEKIRSLETENYTLGIYNRKLEKLLAEKEEIIRKLEPVLENGKN